MLHQTRRSGHSGSFGQRVKFSAYPGESAVIEWKLEHDMKNADEIQGGHSHIVVVSIKPAITATVVSATRTSQPRCGCGFRFCFPCVK